MSRKRKALGAVVGWLLALAVWRSALWLGEHIGAHALAWFLYGLAVGMLLAGAILLPALLTQRRRPTPTTEAKEDER